MANKIGDAQFRIMCAMFGVDEAIKAVKRMGMSVTKDQINNEQKEEAEKNKRWNDMIKSITKED